MGCVMHQHWLGKSPAAYLLLLMLLEEERQKRGCWCSGICSHALKASGFGVVWWIFEDKQIKYTVQLLPAGRLSNSTFLVSAGVLNSSPDELSCRRDNYSDRTSVVRAMRWHIFYFIFQFLFFTPLSGVLAWIHQLLCGAFKKDPDLLILRPFIVLGLY